MYAHARNAHVHEVEVEVLDAELLERVLDGLAHVLWRGMGQHAMRAHRRRARVRTLWWNSKS